MLEAVYHQMTQLGLQTVVHRPELVVPHYAEQEEEDRAVPIWAPPPT